jgi:hypothetical protein
MFIKQRAIQNNYFPETNCFLYSCIERSYYAFKVCFEFIYKGIVFVIKISGIYLLWILLHYAASHLYIKWCVPSTLIGFLLSPFMTTTPHCQSLRWIVYNAAHMINHMWILLGTWICSTFLIVHRENPVNMNT